MKKTTWFHPMSTEQPKRKACSQWHQKRSCKMRKMNSRDQISSSQALNRQRWDRNIYRGQYLCDTCYDFTAIKSALVGVARVKLASIHLVKACGVMLCRQFSWLILFPSLFAKMMSAKQNSIDCWPRQRHVCSSSREYRKRGHSRFFGTDSTRFRSWGLDIGYDFI